MTYKYQSKLIRDARIKAGLSQHDLSVLLGWATSQFVSNIERGKAHIPAKRASRIAHIVSPSKLKDAYIRDLKDKWDKDYKG